MVGLGMRRCALAEQTWQEQKCKGGTEKALDVGANDERGSALPMREWRGLSGGAAGGGAHDALHGRVFDGQGLNDGIGLKHRTHLGG